MSRALGTLSAGCLIGWGIFASGCADPALATSIPSGDGGVVQLAHRDMRPGAAFDPATTSTAATATGPAPFAPAREQDAPSGASCRVGRPPGDCDRCPDRACRQVRVSRADAGSLEDETAEWVPFCHQGDVLDEARIACLCAGGTEHECHRAAQSTVVALAMIDGLFGGEVPPVGHRYRDSDGLRAVVGETMHLWLASSAAPPTTIRCDVADAEAAEQLYQERAQRVRSTGHCG